MNLSKYCLSLVPRAAVTALALLQNICGVFFKVFLCSFISSYLKLIVAFYYHRWKAAVFISN